MSLMSKLYIYRDLKFDTTKILQSQLHMHYIKIQEFIVVDVLIHFLLSHLTYSQWQWPLNNFNIKPLSPYRFRAII